MLHAARQLPSWLIFDVGQNTKLMGTWGHSAFDNDSALDWFSNVLEPSDGDSAIAAAIESVASADQDDYVDGDGACAALAAAELVAALRGRPPAELNPLVADWVSAHPLKIRDSLRALAVRAVSRVEANSELRELWGEAESAGPWRATLADLIKRLSS